MANGNADNTKPGIVLVTGAWHTPVHFEVLRVALEEQGYETYVPRLPTLGRTGLTWKDDAEAVQKAVEKRMDEGKEFVIAAHSYGGIPGCGATKGFTVHDRAAAGKKGGFRAILFIAAFALPEPNLNLLTAFGGEFPLWMAHEPAYSANASSFVYPTAKHAFYSGVPEADADRYFGLLERQSQAAFELPIDFVASNCGIPHTFLVCENDQAMPLPFQEMLVSKIPTFKVERCPSGHSPFITHPQRVIEVLSAM
ncbi:Alpha/beta hydrolase fold-1 [Xylaria sp. FL1777]|nr:Alpha/beta hydrolase fold-1 [Xylaria sp. FL1777]